MVKRVLTFVSGVQESVLVNSISQNLSKLSSSKISLQKRINLDFFYIFFNF